MVAAVSADSSNLASPNLITAPTEQQGQGKATKGPIFALDVSAIREREAAVKDMGKYTTQGVSFDCSGMQCGATLYLPKSTLLTTKLSRAYINAKQGSKASSSKLPAVIVMAHGLGGERVWLDKFAGTFADAGYAVFTFDYRHWGSSDGQPRQWISINKQHADWFDAIKHVQSHLNSVVDPQRLVLWGTSFAGGHVIVVASKLPGQVTAVISNVSDSTQHPACCLAGTNVGTEFCYRYDRKAAGTWTRSIMSVLAAEGAATANQVAAAVAPCCYVPVAAVTQPGRQFDNQGAGIVLLQ